MNYLRVVSKFKLNGSTVPATNSCKSPQKSKYLVRASQNRGNPAVNQRRPPGVVAFDARPIYVANRNATREAFGGFGRPNNSAGVGFLLVFKEREKKKKRHLIWR